MYRPNFEQQRRHRFSNYPAPHCRSIRPCILSVLISPVHSRSPPPVMRTSGQDIQCHGGDELRAFNFLLCRGSQRSIERHCGKSAISSQWRIAKVQTERQTAFGEINFFRRYNKKKEKISRNKKHLVLHHFEIFRVFRTFARADGDVKSVSFGGFSCVCVCLRARVSE